MRVRTTAARVRRTLLSSAAAAVLVFSPIGAPSAFGTASPDGAADDSAASTAVRAPTSFGQEPVPVAGADSDAGSTSDDYGADQDVLSYWTPERMAAAQPADASQGDASDDAQAEQRAAGQSESTGPEGSSEPAAPPQEAIDKAAAALAGGGVQKAAEGDAQPSPADAPEVTKFSVTNGKLFFNGYDKDNAYCSASALNTPTKRVIITAGHCVYDKGEWKKNAVFVPAYNANSADPDPVGIWTVRTLRTFNSWINDRDMTHDVGFATLNDGGDNNQRIVDAVGGHGMWWNGGADYGVSIFGYPSNKTNPEGRYAMWACWGSTFADGGRDSIRGCDFGPGASGGPWLYKYDNALGQGYVRSVTSTWLDSADQNWGPHFFNGDVATMKDAADRD